MTKGKGAKSKGSSQQKSEKQVTIPEFYPAQFRSAFTAPSIAKKESITEISIPEISKKSLTAKSKAATKPQTCKRGNKFCKECEKPNPIHCHNCKFCKAEFPKKDKIGNVKDLQSLMNSSDLGVLKAKITRAHLDQLKSYLMQQFFKDENFCLGKRQDNPFGFDIKEQVVKTLEEEVKLEAVKSSMKIMFNKEEMSSLSRDVNDCGLVSQIVDDRLYLSGRLGYRVQCFKLLPLDTNRVLMLTGLSNTDKCDSEMHDDMDLFTVETQESYGIKRMWKVGRAYNTPSFIGCFLINLKKDKKKESNSFGYSLTMNARHFVPTSSDALHIDFLKHDISVDQKILFSLVGSNGKCEIHSLKTQSLTAQPLVLNPLHPNVQITNTKLLEISISSELISTCKLVSEFDILLGTQNGTLYWIRMDLSSHPSFTIVWSSNHNRNFLVSNICLPVASVSSAGKRSSLMFAASWSDGCIKVIDTEFDSPVFDYQSMSVASHNLRKVSDVSTGILAVELCCFLTKMKNVSCLWQSFNRSTAATWSSDE